MKNLRIGKRLIIAFIILLTITTVSNYYSIGQIQNMNDLDDQLYHGPYVDTSESWSLRRDFVDIARNMNNIFLYDEQAKYMGIILSDFDSIAKSIDKLRKSSPDKMEMLDALENATAILKQECEKIYALTQSEGFSGDIGDIDEAAFGSALNEAGQLATTLNEEAQTEGLQTNQDITRISKKAQRIAFTLSIVSIATGIFISIYITKSLVAPIKEIELAANKMGEGDFDIDISYESKDELGILSNIMMQLSAQIKEIIEDTSNVLHEVATGNFDVKTQAQYIGVFENIENSLNTITEDLSETMSQIGGAAQEVEAASSQVSSGSQMLAQGATEQAGAIEELSATISDISEKIKDTADNAKKANDLTLNASREVEEGNRQMKQMIEAMDNISESSREIGRIIKTIDDIAFQTNILALNAAVEAARAGSAGKGFAVVADEVRNLAAKSAEAAQNTSQLIENSINAVDNGSEIVNNTAQSLQKIIETTNSASNLVDEIAKSCEEETIAITQVTTGIEQISQVVQTNSATSEESAAASEELSGQAQMLNSLIENFKLKNKYSNQNSISFTDEESDYFASSKI